MWNNFFSYLEEIYIKQIGNQNLKLKVECGAGDKPGLNLWTGDGGTYIGIFKDDILYDIRCLGNECTVPVINIPSTIKDEEINNYVIKEIVKYYPDFGNNIYDISKGTGEMNILDGYTVKTTEGIDSYIIIRKNTKNMIEDSKTNVRIEGHIEYIEEGTQLIVKEISNGECYNYIRKQLENKSEKFKIYDISLRKNSQEIQPNGIVKVSLPIPDFFDYNKLVVYKVGNEEIKECDIEIEDGFAIFETDYLSTYILAEKSELDDNMNENETSNIEHILDDTPKTGENNISYVISFIVALVSVLGIVVTKRI